MIYGVPDLTRPLNRFIWRGLDGIVGNIDRSPFVIVGVGRVAFNELTAIGLLLFKRGQQLPVFGTLTNPLDGLKGSARGNSRQLLVDVPHPRQPECNFRTSQD